MLPSLESRTKALLAARPFTPFGREDAQAIALARWFKHDYMKWVDPIKCPFCGGPTNAIGSVEPTRLEKSKGAGRCELHRCTDGACRAERRFPRYGAVSALLRTREGRCGELVRSTDSPGED